MLAVPLRDDETVISGESGAVGMGLLATILEDDTYRELRQALGLGGASRVLMFSTEGNTDPEKFRAIAWKGEYPSA